MKKILIVFALFAIGPANAECPLGNLDSSFQPTNNLAEVESIKGWLKDNLGSFELPGELESLMTPKGTLVRHGPITGAANYFNNFNAVKIKIGEDMLNNIANLGKNIEDLDFIRALNTPTNCIYSLYTRGDDRKYKGLIRFEL